MCSVRLAAVSANGSDGTLTGTPVGGSAPITAHPMLDDYQPSTGFGANPPDSVAQWDAALAEARQTPDPADPNWYGRGKATAFLPRQLNDLAATFPAGTLVLRAVPDAKDPRVVALQTIQPVAP